MTKTKNQKAKKNSESTKLNQIVKYEHKEDVRIGKMEQQLTQLTDQLTPKVKKSVKHVKVRTTAPSGLAKEVIQYVKRLVMQMQNPEFMSKIAPGCQGVPDPCVGASDYTHTFTTIVDLELEVPAGGDFQILVRPQMLGQVVVSGVSSNTTNAADSTPTSLPDITINISLVAKGTSGSASIRINPNYLPGKGFLILYSLGNDSSAPTRTNSLPFSASTGDLVFATKRSQTKAGDAFYLETGTGTPFTTSTDLRLMSTLFATANGANVVRVVLFGSANPVPSFDSTDTIILSANSTAQSNLLTNAVSAKDLSPYQSLWIGAFNTSAFDVEVMNISLSFHNAAVVDAGSALPGMGYGFAFDATVPSPTWKGAVLVSETLLLQLRNATLTSGGDVAGVVANLDPTEQAGTIDYANIVKRMGAYEGNLKDGVYAFWLPKSYESWHTYKQIDSANLAADDNCIIVAGRVPTESTNTILHARVFSVFQVITQERNYNPVKDSYMCPGIPLSEYESIVMAVLSQVPQVTCNPSHAQWTEWIAKMKTYGNRAGEIITIFGKIAATGVQFASILGTVLAAL